MFSILRIVSCTFGRHQERSIALGKGVRQHGVVAIWIDPAFCLPQLLGRRCNRSAHSKMRLSSGSMALASEVGCTALLAGEQGEPDPLLAGRQQTADRWL
jgi:hypothetical protein